MKKILPIVILLIAVLSLSVTAQASTKIAKNADVRVSLVNQEPDPVEPGKYVSVRFKIENTGSESVKDFTLELLPEFPFSLDPGKSAVEELGSLHARQLGETAVIIKYRVRVDRDAVEGENDLKFRYKFDTNVWAKPDPFTIDIQTHDAILNIDSITTNPERVKSGSKASLNIALKNIADSVLKDITVKLNLGGVPLATLGSGDEKTIKTIKANQEQKLTFDLIIEPGAESNTYKVPIKIGYSDDLGNSYSKNSSFGVIIGSEPDLTVGIDSTTIYNARKTGEITVKLVNKGLTDIKFLNIKLAEGADYKIISPQEVYIGNIDSDDYETTDFKIHVEKTKQKKITLPLTLEYKDANNQDYNVNVNLKLPLYTIAEAKKLGLVEENSKVGLFISVLIVVAGIYLYVKWKKRKKKK